MRVRRLSAALLAVGVAVLPGGCALWGWEGGPGGGGPAAPATPSTVGAEAVAGADGVQRMDIVAGDDLRLTPPVVRARPGMVELRFRNVGVTPHTFEARVPSAPGTGNLNGGEERTLRISVTGPGRYSVPCLYHASSGMDATLEIR